MAKPMFSRPVLVASIPETGSQLTVEANEAERAALAAEDGLVALNRLVGTFELRPQKAGGGIAVRGSVSATLVQTCTVTLEPFESELDEPVDLLFLSPERATAWAVAHKGHGGDEPGLADEDPPDSIVDGRIDLGALAAEHLALGIDPYPRAPGVSFEPTPEPDRDPSPFAALAGLKRES